MDLLTYISFGISPLLIIIGILFLKFGVKLKNLNNLFYAVILGAISVLLIFGVNYIIDLQWNGNYNSLRRLLFYVVVVIALSAELGKYLILRLVYYNKKGFEGPIEGIIYSIFISLGFSMAAIVLFAYQVIGIPFNGYANVFLYSYPLLNIVTAIGMGFFIGMGKLRKNFFIDNATGLFVAIFFHGLFYFSIISKDLVLIGIICFGYFLISITLLIRAINLRRNKDD